MFIKYCVFKYIPDSVLSRFPLGVSVCTHIRQVEHQRCTRTGRVQKNHKIKEKTQYLMNTLYLPSCVSVVCVLPLAVSSNFEHFPAKKGLSGPPGQLDQPGQPGNQVITANLNNVKHVKQVNKVNQANPTPTRSNSLNKSTRSTRSTRSSSQTLAMSSM